MSVDQSSDHVRGKSFANVRRAIFPIKTNSDDELHRDVDRFAEAERNGKDFATRMIAHVELHAMLLRGKGEGHWILDAPLFKATIALVVSLNTVQMGLEADYPENKDLWGAAEHFFTAAFFIEMILKFKWLGKRYFQDKWNWLDFTLVLLAVIDTWIFGLFAQDVDLQQLSILRTLRLIRLVRVLRLIRQFQQLAIVLSGIAEAIKATIWIASVMTLTIYVGAVFCVGFLGQPNGHLYPGYSKNVEDIDQTDMMKEFNPYLSFGNIPKSMLTLFNIAILAEWQEVVRPIMVRQPGLVFFFIVFSMFITFGILNVMIAMIVDRVLENARTIAKEEEQREKTKKLQTLNQIQELVRNIDLDNDGKVFLNEIEDDLEEATSPLCQLLSKVNLPHGFSAQELVYLLDEDGDGAVQYEEFVTAFYRMIDCDDFQHLCLVQTGINSIKRKMNAHFDKITASFAEINARNGENYDNLVQHLARLENRFVAPPASDTPTLEEHEQRRPRLQAEHWQPFVQERQHFVPQSDEKPLEPKLSELTLWASQQSDKPQLMEGGRSSSSHIAGVAKGSGNMPVPSSRAISSTTRLRANLELDISSGSQEGAAGVAALLQPIDREVIRRLEEVQREVEHAIHGSFERMLSQSRDVHEGL